MGLQAFLEVLEDPAPTEAKETRETLVVLETLERLDCLGCPLAMVSLSEVWEVFGDIKRFKGVCENNCVLWVLGKFVEKQVG